MMKKNNICDFEEQFAEVNDVLNHLSMFESETLGMFYPGQIISIEQRKRDWINWIDWVEKMDDRGKPLPILGKNSAKPTVLQWIENGRADIKSAGTD